MLTRRGFAISLIGILGGCGRSPEPAASRPKTLAGSRVLSDGDVEAFLEVVATFPERKPPAFQPTLEVDLTSDARAAEMVARWQREFRSSYSPQVQAKLWKRDARLRLAIDESGFEAEQLAGLLVKLSTAVVRESIDPNIDLTQMGQQADRAIESLCRQYDGLDHDPRLSPMARNGRAEFLTQVLKETVAYREFLRLLEAVPRESVVAAGRHRDVLIKLLPATETVRAFETRLESQATVLRASHSEPARSPSARR